MFVFLFAAKILLFYAIFYAVLSGFFGAMLAVFYQTLDMKQPKWQLEKSLIGSNPGLGFRPMPPESNVESTLIWYKASDEGNYRAWSGELDEFLKSKIIIRPFAPLEFSFSRVPYPNDDYGFWLESTF